MKIGKRLLLGALLAAMLLTVLPAGAFAAGYTDLPATHWAYNDMSYADQLDIIQGMGGGRMAPNQTLTWGQCLAMVTRTFFRASYQSAQNCGLAWDAAGLKAAQDNGLVRDDDFLSLDAENLGGPITRQDMAELLYRAMPEEARTSYSSWASSGEDSLSDWNSIPASYRQAVDTLVRLSVVRGREDRSFGGAETLRRCDGSSLLMRTVSVLDGLHRYESMAVTLQFVDAGGKAVGGAVSVDTTVGTYFDSLISSYAPQGYTAVESTMFRVSSVQNSYTLAVRAMTPKELAYEKLNKGQMTWEEFERQDFWLTELGENARKHIFLFGNAETRRYPNQNAAKANMVSITVPVWKLSNGKKVASTCTFQIHSALADDVKAIFTEIYNDPEQFPMHTVGGYNWRGDSAKGEHNCGTAIDINPNENYQVRNGKAETGKLWQPGVNPYSIPENGSVVRAFQAHGWSWGGDAWAWDTDQTTGYHDYMHFSYMGG